MSEWPKSDMFEKYSFFSPIMYGVEFFSIYLENWGQERKAGGISWLLMYALSVFFDHILHGKLANIPCDFCGNETNFCGELGRYMIYALFLINSVNSIDISHDNRYVYLLF